MSGVIALALRLLLTLALYGFLGWALFSFWRDIRREADKVVSRRTPGIGLTVYLADGLISIKHFIQPEILLGRDPVCDIPIVDETVSARHARLTYHHKQWWVEDLGSTNGTLLNKTLIISPTVLTDSDEIELGQVRLEIELPLDASTTSTRQLME